MNAPAAATLEQLRERLAALDPVTLEIIDESHRHAGHAGSREGGGHFRLTLVSPHFAGLRTMERHRLVYDAAGDLMKRQIHALSIIARAPGETGPT